MFGRLIRAGIALGSTAWLARQLFANRGMMPFIPGVEIFEPQQRALLAWNGQEELLVLGTDLHASRPTQVLEVLPLPAEATVARGDPLIFDKLESLIRSRLAWRTRGLGTRSKDATEALPAGEVTQREHIGAHDVSVTHLLDPAGFIGWVEAYLASLGAETPTIPDAMRKIIEGYIADGFTWFVFDVVSLGETIVTNDPIHYRFSSPNLFYPMRITRLAQGDTSVGLYVLTQVPLGRFRGIPKDRVRSRLGELAGGDAMSLQYPELAYLGSEIGDLFLGSTLSRRLRAFLAPQRERGPYRANLLAWQIEGRLASFDADFVVERAQQARRDQYGLDAAELIERWLTDPAKCDPARWDKKAVLPVLEACLIDAWEHSQTEKRTALLELKRALLDEYASS